MNTLYEHHQEKEVRLCPAMVVDRLSSDPNDTVFLSVFKTDISIMIVDHSSGIV